MEQPNFKTRNQTLSEVIKWHHEWKIENFNELFRASHSHHITSPAFKIDVHGTTLYEGVAFDELRFFLELSPDPNSSHICCLWNLNPFDLDGNIKFTAKLKDALPRANTCIRNDGLGFQASSFTYIYGTGKECYGCIISPLSKKKGLCVDHYAVSEDGSLTLLIDLKILVQETKRKNMKRKRHSKPNFKNLRENPIFSDMKIKCTGETFHVHKNILSGKSAVFKAMLSQTDMVESRTGCVEVTDTKALTMRKLLDFIYTGEADDMEENALELLEVANKYEVEDLKIECESILSSNLNLENAIDYLNLASLHQAKTLKQAAIQYLASNIDHV